MEPTPVEEEVEDSEAQATPTTPSEDTPTAAPQEKKKNFQKVVVTEATSCVTFWAQQVEQGRGRGEGRGEGNGSEKGEERGGKGDGREGRGEGMGEEREWERGGKGEY